MSGKLELQNGSRHGVSYRSGNGSEEMMCGRNDRLLVSPEVNDMELDVGLRFLSSCPPLSDSQKLQHNTQNPSSLSSPVASNYQTAVPPDG
ncbi:hypothetical protein PABG_12274 [Paracoccidioides brasiliensis Pb03]|nr:hypothetical protein PABG_12274 [Paracoccidioides brasiliensis Pb03]